MKLSLTTMLITTAATFISARAGETDFIEPLRPAVKQATSEFGLIGAERRKELQQAASFIRSRLAAAKSADVNFICTHNSRRSHLCQIWAQTAATHYGLTNVTTYSGGTEATACNVRTVRALRRAGFSIVQSTGGANPVYLAQYSEARPAVRMYSKRFTDEGNPQKDFAALFACDQAADSCPIVQGAGLHLPIPYVDPKVTDNSPAEAATYDERSRQIAREMFYLMSMVRVDPEARASR